MRPKAEVISCGQDRSAGPVCGAPPCFSSPCPASRSPRSPSLTKRSHNYLPLPCIFRAHRVREATVVSKTTADAVQDALGRLSASVLSPRIRFQEGSFTVTATIRREGGLHPTGGRRALVVAEGQRGRVPPRGARGA